LWIQDRMEVGAGRARYWRKHPLNSLKTNTMFLTQAIGLYIRLMNGVPEKHLRQEYRKRIWRLWKARKDPGILLYYVIKCAIHYHAHTMANQMASGRSAIFNSY
jgi:hypothetical protein